MTSKTHSECLENVTTSSNFKLANFNKGLSEKSFLADISPFYIIRKAIQYFYSVIHPNHDAVKNIRFNRHLGSYRRH